MGIASLCSPCKSRYSKHCMLGRRRKSSDSLLQEAARKYLSGLCKALYVSTKSKYKPDDLGTIW